MTLILAISGIILGFFITSEYGPGITPDSVAYIAGAKNIINGNGITILYNDKEAKEPLKLWASSDDVIEPLIFHWPPFYPLVLALIGIFSSSLINGARLLNILLFGINIILVFIVIKYYTKSIWLSIFSTLIMLTSKVMLFVHTNAIPEPLFLFFSFTGLFLLAYYLEKKKLLFLVLSSLSVSLAFLSRYIGASLVMTGVIGMLIFDYEKIKKKLIDCSVFIVISCTPMFFWLYRTRVVGGNITDREFIFHPITLNEIFRIPVVITKWIIMADNSWVNSTIILSIFAMILFFGFIFFTKKNKGEKKYKNSIMIVLLSVVFIISYLFILIFSRSFFDAKIPVAQDRLLFPVFIASLIIVILFLYSILRFLGSSKIIRVIVYLICIIFTGLYIYNGVSWSVDKHNTGQEYSQRYFLQSEIIKEIKKLPRSTIIYTNASDIIYLFTNRASYVFPVKVNPYTLKTNKNYLTQIKNMVNEVKDKKGLFVIFNGRERLYLPSIEDLKKEIQLCLFAKGYDGEIYEVCSDSLELIYRMDQSNFTDYWEALVACEFDTVGKNVWVKVQSNDPYFESKFPIKFQNKSPLILKILMDSPVESEIRIFYGKPGEPYTYKDSDGYPLKKGENEVYFRIPYMEDLERLRIDPIDTKKDCYIERIEIYNDVINQQKNKY